jgi:hypothetical protein
MRRIVNRINILVLNLETGSYRSPWQAGLCGLGGNLPI